MSLRDRIKSAVQSVQSKTSGASDRARETAKNVELTEEQRQAAARARERAAAAAASARETGPVGNTVGPARGKPKTRTEEMFARAQNAATAGAPFKASIDPTPNEMEMWSFAAAGDVGQPTRYEGDGQGVDWDDNPEHLDTPDEVRQDLRADGLDPMDVASEQDAQFGHMLVHAYEDDSDRGGRSPEQLEAEHDMTVAALIDHENEHDTPMDSHPFEFADPFGAASDSSADETMKGWF
ncbi:MULTISPECIES: hypothetical protein [Halobacterium]|uniref:hypothetical protein n=1 Tax=Halobacterium TaxID=2239 RepID=UPI000B17BB46|nr:MULTISPECIES: hypothetical protein [Halobacterium]MCG1002864.1 hypothetical protein [Halobacterium noricense]